MIEALRLLVGVAERRVGVLGGHARTQAVYVAVLAFFATAALVFLLALATVALAEAVGVIAALAIMALGCAFGCLAAALLIKAEQRAHRRAMARQRAEETRALQAAALNALPALRRGGAMGIVAGLAGLATYALTGRRKRRGPRG